VIGIVDSISVQDVRNILAGIVLGKNRVGLKVFVFLDPVPIEFVFSVLRSFLLERANVAASIEVPADHASFREQQKKSEKVSEGSNRVVT
jgi:hypothetical protein